MGMASIGGLTANPLPSFSMRQTSPQISVVNGVFQRSIEPSRISMFPCFHALAPRSSLCCGAERLVNALNPA